MKVYNKKGLAWGIFWTVLGLFSLYRDFVDPDSFWLQQGKSVVISAVMVLIGVTGFVRAFSKAATREDRIEELDERNRLVSLKVDSLTRKVMGWARVAAMVAGLLGYLFTENLVFGCLFLFAGLSITLEAVVSIAAAIHYEKRL